MDEVKLKKKVLVAEDDPCSFNILKRTFSLQGWEVDGAANGLEALEKLKVNHYDVLMTDLIMPVMNGMKLIERIRTEVKQIPLIILFSAFDDPDMRKRAYELGVFEFFGKPIDFKKLFKRLFEGLKSHGAPSAAKPKEVFSMPQKTIDSSKSKSPFFGVVITSSTGGPQTLNRLFSNLVLSENWSGFLVQHGPAWALNAIAQRISDDFGLKVLMVQDSMKIESKTLYVAPGNLHTIIDSKSFCFKLINGPLENSVRPAADPLFRSAAAVFGAKCIAVVLSGLGRDGAQGAKVVSDWGGDVLIQDPSTAVAPYMPRAAMETCKNFDLVSIDEMGKTIDRRVLESSNKAFAKASL